MNVKCPNCNHGFSVTEDEILFDYDADYNDSELYVWENLPLLRSTFHLVPENLDKD